jgi:hypothetical protein
MIMNSLPNAIDEAFVISLRPLDRPSTIGEFTVVFTLAPSPLLAVTYPRKDLLDRAVLILRLKSCFRSLKDKP